MISVLIPVFNADVRNLVLALSAQIDPDKHEIVVLDDGSDRDTIIINEQVGSMPGVRYYRNTDNTGRISARNKLASLASYEWLLFLDADSGILNNQFIEKYTDAIGNASVIVVGGRVYESSKPLLCEYVLHWKYGKQREGEWRNEQNNIRGFQSSNFLIHCSVFNPIEFPDEIKGYGHEDTWMGIQLEQSGCTVQHISNPVVHLGLENAERFIRKSEQALENLAVIKKYCSKEILIQHVKIFRKYMWLKKTGTEFLFNMLYSLFRKTIWKSIHSCQPDLFLFDIYRMHYFIEMMR